MDNWGLCEPSWQRPEDGDDRSEHTSTRLEVIHLSLLQNTSASATSRSAVEISQTASSPPVLHKTSKALLPSHPPVSSCWWRRHLMYVSSCSTSLKLLAPVKQRKSSQTVSVWDESLLSSFLLHQHLSKEEKRWHDSLALPPPLPHTPWTDMEDIPRFLPAFHTSFR